MYVASYKHSLDLYFIIFQPGGLVPITQVQWFSPFLWRNWILAILEILLACGKNIPDYCVENRQLEVIIKCESCDIFVPGRIT